MVSKTFPIGYYDLHPDASMNFQMNRWFCWVGEPAMLIEMRIAAPRMATYADWRWKFVALAERAAQQGHVLRAGFYWRFAEFFMQANDPDRNGARKRFLEALRSAYGLELGDPVTRRVQAPATAQQKVQLAALSPQQTNSTELAGERIENILSHATGNDEPIASIKVNTTSGWFAARLSGTENIYKIYAESFTNAAHLQRIFTEAQLIVDSAIS